MVAVPSLDSAPVGIALGPDGAMWFAENSGFSVGRVDASGQVTEYAVPPDATGLHGSLNSITAGPDGAMWFTDKLLASPRIGRIAPSTGAVTMYPLPATSAFSAAQPLQIVAGPDGALWFTTFNGSSVGRVDIAGNFTAYPLPKGGSVGGIATGPDGALWFTQVSPDAVGRLDPHTGAITLHPVHSPLGTAAPIGIVTGPDGALWFTNSGTSAIGRLDPASGRITTIRTRTPAAVPVGIAIGPDGAVWFTEAAAGNLGRVNPASHKITEYPLNSALAAPMRLAAGADHQLWVTQTGVDSIARVDPAHPPAGPANLPVAPGVVAPLFADQCPVAKLCLTQVTTGGSLAIKTFTQQLPPGAIRLTGYLSFPANPDGSFTLLPPVVGHELELHAGPGVRRLAGHDPAARPARRAAGRPRQRPVGQPHPRWSRPAHPDPAGGDGPGDASPQQRRAREQLHHRTGGAAPPDHADGRRGSDPPMSWAPTPVQGSDHTFSVPAAQGCGAVPLLFDPVIDLQLGLPSSSGNNAVNLPAVLSETSGVHP